jgi:ribose transport system substrate-binding protein
MILTCIPSSPGAERGSAMPNPDRNGERIGVTRRQALGGAAAVAVGIGTTLLTSRGGAVLASATTEPNGEGATTGEGSDLSKFSDFEPFDPNVPPGPDTGLPRVVATNHPADSQYFIEMNSVVRQAVEDRGFEYVETTYGSDVAQNIDQLAQLQQRGIGAIILQPQDAAGQAETLRGFIEDGIAVIYQVTAPSIIQIAADQHAIGYTQGVEAAKWIEENLGGEAQVIIFNSDQISQSLAPRAQGRIDGLATGGPGIEVVANQPIQMLTADEGSTLAGTLIQAHPDANVWLGDDDTIIGVQATLLANGAQPTDPIYLSGVNGQSNALEEVKKGGLFRADIAFPNGIYQYAVGQLACDWIEGKSVPQVLNIHLVPVTAENVDAFVEANSNPAAAYEEGIEEFLEYLGNVDYRNRMTNYLTNSVS